MASISDHGSLRIILRSNSSSSHGHESPPQEASTLLSPGPLHRDAPVQERDMPAITEDVEEGNETQPSLSSCPAPSNPSSTREEKDARPTSFRRTTHWKTVGMVVGFLFAAFLSALGHYILFRRLDRELTDTVHLTQSLVSAVSILLTTIFKAALTASTGICFAQHLWYVLRGNAMSLATIEKLFVFRTNILVLGDLRSIWRAPLLFFMALFVWCLGIATIYPPGALIVTFEAHNYTKNLSVPVMNPPVPRDLKFFDDNVSFPTLGYNPEFNHGAWTSNASGVTVKLLRYPGTPGRLLNIARSTIMNGQVLDLIVHPGENSTFNMQFRAPQFHCTSSAYNHSLDLRDPLYDSTNLLLTPEFASEWHTPASDEHILKYSVRKHSLESVTVIRRPDNITTYEAQLETFEQSCWPKSMLYNVTISFPRGVRKIEHTLSDARAVPDPKDIYDHPLPYLAGGNNSIYMALPAEPKALEEWNQKILTALPVLNEWVLLDALGSILPGHSRVANILPDPNGSEWEQGDEDGPNYTKCKQRELSENSTIVYDCFSNDYGGGMRQGTPPHLVGSVFDTQRFNPMNDYVDQEVNDFYDISNYYNITEDILNDVLTNITLSALSLGTWWDNVTVTTTRYQSTYSFTNPLNLILPYSVCFAAATLFAAIAIWSLWRNGVPAADGGFLQIMTATRGNTEMERLVLKERLIAIDNMSKELKNLKIRYGELVGEDVLGVEGKRLGFGTVEETVSLRKKK